MKPKNIAEVNLLKMINRISIEYLTEFLIKEMHINSIVAPVIAEGFKGYSKQVNEIGFAPADDVPMFPLQKLFREPQEWPYDDATLNIMNSFSSATPSYVT